ncbi:MAG: DMT family transporter [Fidelibacterota bacterium]|nr:MAG: DMT family transporter [Candidatus Neomarinimicrobiota bacterium]
MNRTPFALAAGIVLMGSLLASSAAVWIRFLPGMSPFAIGFIRTAAATLIFFPWFWKERRRQRIPWYEFRYSVAAGVALAFHFATWIASLRYTSVANSVLFVSTHPLFVIAISIFILRVPVARNQVLGAGIALVGIAFIQWRDLSFVSTTPAWSGSAWGNMLALAGGFFGGIYLLFGRQARQNLSTILHVEVTYGVAAIVLLAAVCILQVPIIPLEPEPWLFLGLLILLPTIGGHTIFNWGVHHIGAPLVALFGLLEPVESALLAFLLLGEGVGTATIVGGAIILSGLALAVWQPGIRSPAAT